eukprot:9171138-Lingulodinium_polyedra.AAC.1
MAGGPGVVNVAELVAVFFPAGTTRNATPLAGAEPAVQLGLGKIAGHEVPALGPALLADGRPT